MRYAILLVLAVALGIARFIVPVEGKIDHADIFKDIAHLFVGGVFGAAILATICVLTLDKMAISWGELSQRDAWLAEMRRQIAAAMWFLWAIAWGLTALEVVAFLVRQAP